MAFDAYSPCPCGSGKKFKWCCQPIHVDIDRAFRQDQDGQHEAALRIMDEVTNQHPANPEAWGRKAQLLFQNDRVDDAEQALQKAFEINANYPFGYFLRGLFRQHEGELTGALMLFRKAAELYDPQARDILAEVYVRIGDSELKLNRPIAAHAALRIVMNLAPSEELRKDVDGIFGEQSRLPLAARREYTFQSPPTGAAEPRRQSWNRALSGAASGHLGDAAAAFEQLTREDVQDAAAWYNLSLVRAWMGDNRRALEAIDRYVTLEADEGRAAEAWALAEVLRFGQGMEDQADYVDHSAVFQIREPRGFSEFIRAWQQERRLTAVQVNEQDGVVTGLVLDRGALLTGGAAANQPARLGAYLLIAGNALILRSTVAESLDRARQEVQQRAGPSLSEPRLARGPATFADVVMESVLLPFGATTEEEAQKLVRDHVQRYFEESWIHRPLRSLNGATPLDAAGHAVLRKKLRGAVQFLEQCTAGGNQAYDFERLRRKLGLTTDAARPVAEAAATAAPDIDAMAAPELAALQTETLSEDQIDQAFRAAQRLDAQELAHRFARALVAHPPRTDHPDRFPWYASLVQHALATGDTDTALQYVDEGEKVDCEHNEGRRRNDYELRRGQVLAKRGEADGARDVFERLLSRVPDDLRYRGTATESMLALKQGATALQFAEMGVAKARQKNDRDSEQYFLELASAARRQIG